MPMQTPSVVALEFSPGGPLAADARLIKLRAQVAVVRTIADQVEQLSRAADVDGLGTQVVEEMTRLGCYLLETAAALADFSPVDNSGIFKRPAMVETVPWQAPTYDLVRMDAEIGSYQEDHDPGREMDVVES
jgi:hypothetical protein